MRSFCVVLVSTMLGGAACAPSPGDDEPPVRDGGHEPADGSVADAPAADGAPVDGAGDRTPPTITGTSPGDGATDADPALVVTVTFDEPVRAPAGAFQLLDEAGEPVPGAVAVDVDALRFVPADDLALLGAYTAIVTPAVTDAAGNALAHEHRFQLRVRDGAWDLAGTRIEDRNTGNPRTPDVAMDDTGNVTVVWSQPGPPYDIWANHHDARTGRWETARLLEHAAGDAVTPRVAMDRAGNAMAVWQQAAGTHSQVWACRRDAATGWDEPVRLDVSDTGDAWAPRIAMNADGAAIAIWRQREGTSAEAWMSRHVAGAWATAEPVLVDGAPVSLASAGDPVVAIDRHGDALVLVLDHAFHLQAVPHLAATGWGQAETLIQGPATGPDLAMAPAGHAVATWALPQPSRIQAWRRDPDGAQAIDLLMETSETEMGQLRAGDVAINRAGEAIAVWLQDTPGPPRLWASVYDAAAARAWNAPQALVPDDFSQLRGAQVAIDPRGHAHAIWLGTADFTDSLMTARRVAPGGFGEAGVHVAVEDARVAVNSDGKAVIIRAVQVYTHVGRRVDLDAVFFR